MKNHHKLLIFRKRSVAGAYTQTLPVAGAIAWHDLDDVNYLFKENSTATPVTSTNDTVGYIGDKSGNGNHALQATTLSRPLWQYHFQNGRNAAYFDGSRYVDIAASINNAPLTVLLAGKRDASVSTTQGLWSSRDSVTGGIRLGFNSSNQVAPSSASPSSSRTSTATFGANSLFIAGLQITNVGAGGSIVSIANTEVGSSSSTYTSMSNFFGWARLNTNNTSSLARFYMFEGIVFPTVLGTTDLNTMLTYLNDKWAIY